MLENVKLVLIDGNALLYRAFYALPPLMTGQGTPTGGVYGFTRILMKLLQEEKPDYIACAFDKGKKTFRHKTWEEYKITRPETPHQLSLQIPLTKKVLEGFQIPVFEEEEYEADDILATLAKKAEQFGLKVTIFTADKDILQVVSACISITQFKKGLSQTETFNPDKVKQSYGISSEQIADYLSLVGDVSDNIPGVRGIGPKTATGLIQKFGSVEELLVHIDRIPANVASKIKENEEQIKLSKKLATIVTNVPLKFELEDLKTKLPDKDTLLVIFEELEFRELIKKTKGESSEKKEKAKAIPGTKILSSLANTISTSKLVVHLDKTPSGEKITLSPLDKDAIFEMDLDKDLESPAFKKLKEALSSDTVKKIGQNLKEMLVTLEGFGINLKGIEFDISIATYLINSSCKNYSLHELCVNFLDDFPHDFDLSSPSFRIQCMKKLYFVLKKELEKNKMHRLFYEIEMPLVEILAGMEVRGIKVDAVLLKDFLGEIETERRKIEKEIYEIAGEEFNINSYKELGNILFQKFNLPPVKKIKTGYSTNEDVLRTLSIINPDIKKILEYRYLSKLESSYIKPLSKLINPSTGKIHTSFSQTTASTGRLSSFKPNLQNIPVKEELGAKMRRCFVADEGYLFVSADYSQIELRILAHLSQDKKLLSAFRRGDDIHRETAAEIFNVLPLQVSSQMRREAKIVNFGIIYGMSPFGLAQSLGISEKEAEEYIHSYFNRYLGVKVFIENTIQEAQEKGFVTTIMGRRRYTPVIHSQNTRKRKLTERIAINSRIQGSAADLIKLAMVNVYKRLKKENLPAWIILQIHDELLLEVAMSKIDEVRKLVKKEMEEALRLSVPIVVNTKVGNNWAQMNY
ncbi:DNA polymerase I [Candidatus Aerophobetes bacterium]|nr:DNA polymerase I [Candidatus Aerophobetes bacterium]